MDGTYLSARSNIRLNFKYRLDGELINDGDQPIFDPGELDFSVRTIGENEQNETRVIKGLKGIPYLKVEYEQIGEEIVLSGQLSGLHPDHIADLDQNLKLHESIKFERLKDDGSLLIDCRS